MSLPQPATRKDFLPAWAETAGVFLFLAVTFWIIRYWHSGAFGWYEDDLTIIPRAVTLPAPDLFAYVWSYIYHLYGHARPLSDSMIYVFSHFGWKLGGIAGAYWIGYGIQVLNILLFYLLLKRVHSRLFALTGSLAYILFSADTTQVFLTHSLGLHPSITLLLLASHAYLSGRKILAYLLAFIILFSYETPFLLFLAVPLLQKDWDWKKIKEWVFHGLILGALLVGIILLRSAVGEGRVEGLTPAQMITTPILHMLQGPPVSLGTYFYRPIQALGSLNLEVILASLLAFLAIFWALWRTRPGFVNLSTQTVRDAWQGFRPARLAAALRRGEYPQEIPPEWKALIRLAAAGLVLLVLAYPLTFTVRAYAISGRDTRVHAAAVVGAAVLWASLGTFAISFAAIYRKKALAVLPLAALFALLAGYGFVIQRDYTQGWQLQKQFWTEIQPLIQDAGADTVILVEPTGLRDTRQMGANTWNLPRILSQIYTFPPDWKNPPRVYRLAPNWQNQILTEDGQFQINAATSIAPPSLYVTADPENVIFIETKTGRLERRKTPLPLGDREYELKTVSSPTLQAYPPGFLYPLLVQEPYTY